MGKVVLIIVCILFLLAFADPISDGIHNWRTDEITQTASITTGGGVTTGNIVLTRGLFDDSISQIYVLSSSYSETPIAGTYTAATKTLQLTNLTESQTRTITLSYYSETEDEYLMIIGPFLAILIFGGIIFAILMNAKSKGRR